MGMTSYAERIMRGDAPTARGTHDRVHPLTWYAAGEAGGSGSDKLHEPGRGFGDADGAGSRHGEGIG